MLLEQCGETMRQSRWKSVTAWWNSDGRTVLVEQWHSDGGTVKQCWWNSERVIVEQWNKDGGIVWWNSGTVMV